MNLKSALGYECIVSREFRGGFILPIELSIDASRS